MLEETQITKSTNQSRRDFLSLAGIVGGGIMLGCGCGAVLGGALLIRRNNKPDPTPQTIELPSPVPLAPDYLYPAMINRADWGALEPDHQAENERGFYSEDNPEGWRVYDADLTGVYNTVIVHHSAFYESDDLTTMAEIQQTHRQQRGWADVAYHYIVGRAGTVYEGRSIFVRGTHTAGYNTGTVGLCLMGNFMDDFPTDAQINRSRDLIQWLAQQLSLTHLGIHRTFNPDTACPGDNLVEFASTFAVNAGLQIGTGGYTGIEGGASASACGCACCSVTT